MDLLGQGAVSCGLVLRIEHGSLVGIHRDGKIRTVLGNLEIGGAIGGFGGNIRGQRAMGNGGQRSLGLYRDRKGGAAGHHIWRHAKLVTDVGVDHHERSG